MNVQVMDAGRGNAGSYKVDVSRGERIGRVSSEWFSRPDDERFLSLDDLARSVRGRAERSRTRVVETAASRPAHSGRSNLLIPAPQHSSKRRLVRVREYGQC